MSSAIAYDGDLVGIDHADERVFDLNWDALNFDDSVEIASHNIMVKGQRPAAVSISSLTRSGSTATATCASAHGLTTGDRVTVGGANQKEYNISATVTVTSTVAFTYSVSGTPDSPATGDLGYSQGLELDSQSVLAGNRIGQVRLKAQGVAYIGRRYEIAHRVVTNETPAQTKERSFYVEITNER